MTWQCVIEHSDALLLQLRSPSNHSDTGHFSKGDDELERKLDEKCVERRVIGDRCDRYGRSGVRGIRRGEAKPEKLGSG